MLRLNSKRSKDFCIGITSIGRLTKQKIVNTVGEYVAGRKRSMRK